MLVVYDVEHTILLEVEMRRIAIGINRFKTDFPVPPIELEAGRHYFARVVLNRDFRAYWRDELEITNWNSVINFTDMQRHSVDPAAPPFFPYMSGIGYEVNGFPIYINGDHVFYAEGTNGVIWLCMEDTLSEVSAGRPDRADLGFGVGVYPSVADLGGLPHNDVLFHASTVRSAFNPDLVNLDVELINTTLFIDREFCSPSPSDGEIVLEGVKCTSSLVPLMVKDPVLR
jgi:hypothetical protein